MTLRAVLFINRNKLKRFKAAFLTKCFFHLYLKLHHYKFYYPWYLPNLRVFKQASLGGISLSMMHFPYRLSHLSVSPFFYCQSAVLSWSILLVCHLLYVQYIHTHYKYFSGFLWHAGFTTSILIDFVAYTTSHFWFWSNSPFSFFVYH